MSDVGAVLGRQLHFVTGKGGVGKSVVACALAQHFASQGHDTLLAQVNTPDTHAALLETSAIPHELHHSERHLWLVNMRPENALREYALLTLKIEALYRAVFENRVTRAFLRFVPSMNELTLLGKIWHHAEERSFAHARFARIVVDLPSSGHGLKLLRTAEVISAAVRIGPMAEKTRAMSTVLADPDRTALHVVSLPEELPVNESLELLEEAQSLKTVPPGLVFMNRLAAPLFRAHDVALVHRAQQRVEGVDATVLSPLFAAGARRIEREANERHETARLRAFGRPVVEFPQRPKDVLGRKDLQALAAILARAEET